MEYSFINEHEFDNYYNVERTISKLLGKHSSNIECIGKQIFTKIVSYIMSFHLNNPESKEPYTPLFTSNNEHSYFINNISDFDAENLFSTIEVLTDSPIILSRIFDVLWVAKNPVKNYYIAGEKASKNYLKYIHMLLDINEYFNASSILKRYYYQAMEMGSKSAVQKNLLTALNKFLSIELSYDNRPFVLDLYKIFSDFKNNDISKILVDKLEKFADDNLEDMNEYQVENYFAILTKHIKIIEDENKLTATYFKWHEYYIKLSATNDYPLSKIAYLKQAIEALRKIPGNIYKNTIANIQKQIELIQPLQIQNMQHFQTDPIDISELVKNNIIKVSGKSLFDAMRIIARNVKWLDKDEILSNKETTMPETIGKTVNLNSKGQVKNSSKFSQIQKITINSKYNFRWLSALSPMLDIMREEHRFGKDDFIKLFHNHFFIPEEYERSYSKGIYYYLVGDYFEAAHISIPAFENSLRYMVSVNRPTSYFEKNGDDKNIISIDDLIANLEEDKRITEDMSFTLTYFFGKDELNLRNELMHGLLTYEEINSVQIAYGLSLIFWLVMYPYISK